MYIVFDLIENDFEILKTEKEAVVKADEWLERYQEEAQDEGWPENIEGSVGYAEVKARSIVTSTESKKDNPDDWPYLHDEIWYVNIVEVDKEK